MVSVFTDRYRSGILLKQDSCPSDNLALTYCSQIQQLVAVMVALAWTVISVSI
jgi:hypothetical protein